MAKNYILFDVKEHFYSEDQGMKKTEEKKSLAVQVELYISTKKAAFLS